MAKRKTLEGKLTKRDVITEHSDYGSQTYAPLSRHGVFPDRHSQSNVKSHFLDTYQGLLELEAGLPPSVQEPQIKTPRPKKNKGFISRSDRREIELLKTYEALKDKKVKVEEKKPLRFLYRVEKPVPRPPTPVVDEPPEVIPFYTLAVKK
ncbi:cilia- and flagella-associated protein 91-like [Tachysurus ichikawai]